MSLNLDEIKEYADFFNKRILDHFSSIEPEILKNSSLHLILSGGKRLRPFILSKIASFYGMDYESSLPAAASVELIHNFSLIHDDIMDKDKLRHGKPTVHEAYGLDFAILSGDLLFALAFKSLNLLRNKVEKSRLLKCYHELSNATVKLAIGQGLDIYLSRNEIFDYKKTIRMIQYKTSALFEASCAIGALISKAKMKEVELIKKFARFSGIAFQIKDDLLGTFGDEKLTGKPVGNDLREGKKTLIVIHAYKHGDYSLRSKLNRVLGNTNVSFEEIKSLIEEMKKIGSYNYAIEKSNYYLNLAKSYLNYLRKDLADFLYSFGKFLVERNY